MLLRLESCPRRAWRLAIHKHWSAKALLLLLMQAFKWGRHREKGVRLATPGRTTDPVEMTPSSRISRASGCYWTYFLFGGPNQGSNAQCGHNFDELHSLKACVIVCDRLIIGSGVLIYQSAHSPTSFWSTCVIILASGGGMPLCACR